MKSELDLDLLIDFLMSSNWSAFRSHLLDLAVSLGHSAPTRSDRYSLEDIRSMADHLNPPDTALSSMISREAGTLRFGRSLRLLGAQQPSALREVVEELESVRALHQLLATLARSTQMCVLTKATSEFIIVPSEEDVELLLEDVERFGIKDVVAVLIILSAVRYPTRREQLSESNDAPFEPIPDATPS